jgi:hypothetical protein
MSFSLLCLHYPWTNKRAGCDADPVNISYKQVCCFKPVFKNPARIYGTLRWPEARS